MLPCQVRLPFWTALGVACHCLSSLITMSPFGPTVSTSFLSALLSWPLHTGHRVLLILCKFGISCHELLIMFEQSVEHRLFCEKVIRPHLRARRPLMRFFPSFPSPPSAPPLSRRCEMKQGCEFLHGLFRSVGHFPGGLAQFIPCQPGANSTRLIHLGWEQCGHGLFSRPRENFLAFFGYIAGAELKLFSGSLKPRCSCTPFARRLLTWPVQCQSRSCRIMTL